MARIKDIAKMAKVSPSTVSNVIHKRVNKVSPEIYARVEKILEEEHYVTHMGARMLSKKGSKLIALILAYKRIEKESSVEDPFVASVVGKMPDIFFFCTVIRIWMSVRGFLKSGMWKALFCLEQREKDIIRFGNSSRCL